MTRAALAALSVAIVLVVALGGCLGGAPEASDGGVGDTGGPDGALGTGASSRQALGPDAGGAAPATTMTTTRTADPSDVRNDAGRAATMPWTPLACDPTGATERSDVLRPLPFLAGNRTDAAARVAGLSRDTLTGSMDESGRFVTGTGWVKIGFGSMETETGNDWMGADSAGWLDAARTHLDAMRFGQHFRANLTMQQDSTSAWVGFTPEPHPSPFAPGGEGPRGYFQRHQTPERTWVVVRLFNLVLVPTDLEVLDESRTQGIALDYQACRMGQDGKPAEVRVSRAAQGFARRDTSLVRVHHAGEAESTDGTTVHGAAVAVDAVTGAVLHESPYVSPVLRAAE